MKILVISGTGDGRKLIELLIQNHYEITVSVATSLGAQYLQKYKNITIHIGKMEQNKMKEYFIKEKFDIAIDASHPYARCVSEFAMNICEKLNIDYIRFERQKSEFFDGAIYVKNFSEAIEKLNQMHGAILFTTGTNHLEEYKKVSNWENRVFVRVLNEKSSIEKCSSSGFSEKNIICENGPFTKEQNLKHLIQYHIQVMVTKDGGKIGGTIEKISAAQELKIPVVVIERPQINYKNKFETFKEVFYYIKALEERKNV